MQTTAKNEQNDGKISNTACCKRLHRAKYMYPTHLRNVAGVRVKIADRHNLIANGRRHGQPLALRIHEMKEAEVRRQPTER